MVAVEIRPAPVETAGATSLDGRLQRIYEDRRPLHYRDPVQTTVSGVVVAPGIVATSLYHARLGATEVHVRAPDGRRLQGHLLGSDANKDLLLIGVDDDLDVQPAPRAAAPPVPGRFVCVVGRGGTPLSFTTTRGIVSGLACDPDGTGEASVVQTDASVNYGNLGGAVLDLDGGLLGVATFVSGTARTGLNSGVAFFVPVAAIDQVLPRLAVGEQIPRRIASPVDPDGAFLGVQFDAAGEDGGGVRVVRIVEDGPAALAGVVAGDVIAAMDDEPAADPDGLGRRIRGRRPGDRVRLALRRGETRVEVEAVLDRRGDR